MKSFKLATVLAGVLGTALLVMPAKSAPISAVPLTQLTGIDDSQAVQVRFRGGGFRGYRGGYGHRGGFHRRYGGYRGLAIVVTAIVAMASVVPTFLVPSTAAAIVIQPINIVVDTATAAMATGAVSIGVAFTALATDTVAGIVVDSVVIEARTSHIVVVDAVDNVLETPPSFKHQMSGVNSPHSERAAESQNGEVNGLCKL
jgi:hypothetical protein